MYKHCISFPRPSVIDRKSYANHQYIMIDMVNWIQKQHWDHWAYEPETGKFTFGNKDEFVLFCLRWA